MTKENKDRKLQWHPAFNGFDNGFNNGFDNGFDNGIISTFKNMIKKGFSIETAQECTELSNDLVEKALAEMNMQ